MDAAKADKDGKSPPVLTKMAAARISRIFHENNKLGDLPAEERLRKRESGIRVSGKVSSRIRQREKLSAML